MPAQRNTYRRLDLDTSKNKFGKESYADCRNMRMISNDPNESGAMHNFHGNEELVSQLPGYPADVVIGSKQIRNKVVLFSTSQTDAEPTNAYGRIWTIDLSVASPVPTLLYNGQLNLSRANPIYFIVTRYESEDVQKVYWTDGYNYFRFANIAEDLTGKNPSDFDVVTDFSFESPQLTQIVNGRIPVGRVQYSFRLYKKYGTQTIFVPPSRMINITESNEGVDLSYKYQGTERLDDAGQDNLTGKGVRMTISNIDTDYDRIEIIAIHYADDLENPNIYVVADMPVDDSITFTDSGEYDLGTYTVQEYSAMANLFKCKTINTHKNILFAGNVQEVEFDVDYDTRAYRYRGVPASTDNMARIVDSSGAYYIHRTDSSGNQVSLLGYGGADAINNLEDVPQDWDCICPNNDLDDDFIYDPAGRYKYQRDGSTEGGEGPNVKYSFSNVDGVLDQSPDANRFYAGKASSPDHFTDFASPNKCAYKLGYFDDEIYRFAVEFYNTKGQVSPAKWIGDIRFPGNQQFSYDSSGKIYHRTTYIVFEFSNLPDDVAGFRILRVERKQEDKTVLFTGKLQSLSENRAISDSASNDVADDWYVLSAGNALAASQKSSVAEYQANSVGGRADYLWLTSPEISYLKSFEFTPGDYIRVAGYFDSMSDEETQVDYYYSEEGISDLIEREFSARCIHLASKYRDYNPLAHTYSYLKNLDNAWIVEATKNPDASVDTQEFDTLTMRNIVYANAEVWSSSRALVGNAGTGLLIKTDGGRVPVTGIPSTAFPFIVYKRKAVQYGGNTFEARTSNTYIPVTDYIPKTGASMSQDTYGGDCFVGMFDQLNSFFNQSYITYRGNPTGGGGGLVTQRWGATLASVDFWPVQTSINLNLAHGSQYNRSARNQISQEYYNLRPALHLKETGNDSISWNATNYASQTGRENQEVKYLPDYDDYYKYNAVFSRVDELKKGIAVDTDYEAVKLNDTKVLASASKFPEETIDSWTNFGLNESIIVDANFGPINYLPVLDNQLLFFQDNGFGALAVLERSLINDSEGRNLTLGEGDVLQRFDMIKTDRGCSTNGSLLVTNSSIVWWDAKRHRLHRIRDGVENHGVIKGVNSWLQSIDDTIAAHDNLFNGSYKGFDMVENPKHHEVWFTVSDGFSTGETLVYCEIEDAFKGWYDNPLAMGYLKQDDHLFCHRSFGRLYKENSGNVPYCQVFGSIKDAYITVPVNVAETLVFTLDALELTTEIFDDSGDNLVDETITSLQVWNSYQDTGVITITPGTNIRRLFRSWRFNTLRDDVSGRPRLRDSYAMVKMIHRNSASNNRKFVLHDLVSIYEMLPESVVNKR